MAGHDDATDVPGAPRARAADPATARFDILDRETFRRLLEEIGRTRMPFGKYGPQSVPPDGLPIDELSLDYLQWFRGKGGFPKGKLGELMALVYEIKATGMDEVFGPCRSARGGITPKPRKPRVRKFLD